MTALVWILLYFGLAAMVNAPTKLMYLLLLAPLALRVVPERPVMIVCGCAVSLALLSTRYFFFATITMYRTWREIRSVAQHRVLPSRAAIQRVFAPKPKYLSVKVLEDNLTIAVHEDAIFHIALEPSNPSSAAATAADISVVVSDALSAAVPHTLSQPEDFIFSVAFRPTAVGAYTFPPKI
jgi:hypothetical protein